MGREKSEVGLSGEFLARGSGPGVQTEDGCSVEFYKRVPYRGELDGLQPLLDRAGKVLELGCGTGRMTRALRAAGAQVVAVDNSPEMLSELPAEVRAVRSSIEDLEIDETFDVVILASYLINTPDHSLRAGFLATGRSHLAEDGRMLIECQDPELLRGIEAGRESTVDGITTRVESVTQRGNQFRLVMRYVHGKDTWTHEFDTLALDKEDVENALDESGLAIDQWQKDVTTWAIARHR